MDEIFRYASAREEASRIVSNLLRMETRGSGDIEPAMRRLALRYRMDWRTFWSLKYRPPKDVFAGVLRQLQAAQLDAAQRQLARLTHELELSKASGVDVEDLHHQVSGLADQLHECMAQYREISQVSKR